MTKIEDTLWGTKNNYITLHFPTLDTAMHCDLSHQNIPPLCILTLSGILMRIVKYTKHILLVEVRGIKHNEEVIRL